MGNLLGGMAMLGLLWWLGLRPAISTHEQRRMLHPWLAIGLVAGALQLYLGAWNSANFAALACDSLSSCGAIDWQGTSLGDTFNLFRQLTGADGRVVIDDSARIIHMTHRLGAVLAFVCLSWLALCAITAGGPFRTTGVMLLVLVTLQPVLGVSAVYFGLPLGLVLIHNIVAALLLVNMLTLSHRAYFPAG
jgi:cytochrome c oxidase assembly protein subunit 15